MTSKHRRAIVAALEARNAAHCVSLPVLSDALRDAGLSVCRVGYVSDLKEALSDLYTGHTRGQWPADGRDACMGRVLALLGNGRCEDGN